MKMFVKKKPPSYKNLLITKVNGNLSRGQNPKVNLQHYSQHVKHSAAWQLM